MPRKRPESDQPRKTLAEVREELHALWQAWTDRHQLTRARNPGPAKIGAAYVRESHKDSIQGLSPTSQLTAMLEDAERQGITIPWEHVYIDNVTGKHDRRPDFLTCLEAARRMEFRFISFFHSSRMFRNVGLAKRYKTELRDRGIEIRQLNLPIDTTTAMGRFVETMAEATDQLQSDSTGEWVSTVLRDKAESGQPLGRLPEYLLKNLDGSIQQHPVLAPIVRAGVERYLRNLDGECVGFGDLAKWATVKGYRTPRGSALDDEWWRNVMAQPQVAGHVGYKFKRSRGGAEKLVRAPWDGIVTLDEFNRIGQVRKRRTRVAGKSATVRVYALPNCVCPCGAQVTVSSKGRLRCRAAANHRGCEQRSVPADHLETQFGAWISEALSLTPEVTRAVAVLIERQVAAGSDAGQAERLRQAINRIGKRFAWDQTYTEDAYRAELGDLQTQLAKVDRGSVAKGSMDALQIASDFARTWEAATPKARRAFVERFIDRVVVEDGWLTAVRPKADIAPLLAVKVRAAGAKAAVESLGGKVQRGGPDRGWDRSIEQTRGGLEGGRRAGFVVVAPAEEPGFAPDALELRELWVVPDARGRGIGGAAIAGIMDLYGPVEWEYFVFKSNTGSQRLVVRVLQQLAHDKGGTLSKGTDYTHRGCEGTYWKVTHR